MKLQDLAYLVLQYDGPIRGAAPFPGGDGRGFGTGTGRIEGEAIRGNLRWANIPVVRSDNVVVSDFNGIIEPDEGDIVLFRLHGYAVPSAGEGPGIRILRDSMWHCQFTSAGQDYAFLNNAFVVAEAAVLHQPTRVIGVRLFSATYEGPGALPTWVGDRWPETR